MDTNPPARIAPILERIERYYAAEVRPARDRGLRPLVEHQALAGGHPQHRADQARNDESSYRIADRAVQLHGAAGIMKDKAINKLFLLARNLRIPGGTGEVQRTTIAETLGRRARD